MMAPLRHGIPNQTVISYSTKDPCMDSEKQTQLERHDIVEIYGSSYTIKTQISIFKCAWHISGITFIRYTHSQIRPKQDSHNH